MPRTKKKFNWEIYDARGEFIDILVMSRDEAREYHKQFPDFILQEISYTEND